MADRRKMLSVLFVLALGVMVVQPAVAAAPGGQLPGAMVADTVNITATVEAIDYAKRTVTLKVDKSAKDFKNVNKGDQVVARFTEAVAIFPCRNLILEGHKH